MFQMSVIHVLNIVMTFVKHNYDLYSEILVLKVLCSCVNSLFSHTD